MHPRELPGLQVWEWPQQLRSLPLATQGRRFSVYIPEGLVPEVRSAVRNGRLLQDLINDAGVRYVRALKKNMPPESHR